MADKPYIEFRLNPDKLKEELRGIVPGYRALEYFHNNPDSSFTNTLDLLAEDVVPFYAAHKYGAGPGDYIKEAVLMGMPIPKAKFKVPLDANGLSPKQYKFIREEVNNPTNTTRYIDPNGRIYEELTTDPNKVSYVDNRNWKPIDKADPNVELYDLDPNTYNDIYNAYNLILNNATPAKVKKVRRYGNAGEDIQVGNETYKPTTFNDHYKALNERLDKLSNKKSLTPDEQLELKQIQSEIKMLESADDFTQSGPYLNNNDNIRNNILSDNSQTYIEEPLFSYTSENPLWLKKLRRNLKEGEFK